MILFLARDGLRGELVRMKQIILQVGGEREQTPRWIEGENC